MLRVVEGLEFVTVEAVLSICQKVEKKDGQTALDQEANFAAVLRAKGLLRYTGLGTGRLGGNGSTSATVHHSMLHQERARITWILRVNVDL